MRQHRIGDEARALGVDVAVARAALAMCEEALRNHQVKLVLGPRHGDIKKAPFFLNFRRRAGSKVGGKASIDGVEKKNCLPLLPLGGMDCGKDQVILVEKRGTRLIARGIRGIKCKFGQEPFSTWICGGDLRKLKQIGLAKGRVFVNALKMRQIPAVDQIKLRRPTHCVSSQHPDRCFKIGPVSAAAAGVSKELMICIGLLPSAMRSRRRAAKLGPMPGNSCATRNPATRSRRFCAQRRTARTSLM